MPDTANGSQAPSSRQERPESRQAITSRFDRDGNLRARGPCADCGATGWLHWVGTWSVPPHVHVCAGCWLARERRTAPRVPFEGRLLDDDCEPVRLARRRSGDAQ